jgi:glutaredoxin-related protein
MPPVRASRSADVPSMLSSLLQVQDALLKLTGGRSVPRVFVDGKFIGGGDDTAAMARDGRLKTMLVSAGIMSAM